MRPGQLPPAGGTKIRIQTKEDPRYPIERLHRLANTKSGVGVLGASLTMVRSPLLEDRRILAVVSDITVMFQNNSLDWVAADAAGGDEFTVVCTCRSITPESTGWPVREMVWKFIWLPENSTSMYVLSESYPLAVIAL